MDGFDDLAGCSKCTVHRFSHKFCEWMDQKYYTVHVKWPKTQEDNGYLEKPCKDLGLPGSIAAWAVCTWPATTSPFPWWGPCGEGVLGMSCRASLSSIMPAP